MTRRWSGQAWPGVVVGAALFVLAGCATAPPAADVPKFRAAVSAVAAQTQALLDDANALAIDNAVDAALTAKVLTEGAFVGPVAAADVAAWASAFDALERYATRIEARLAGGSADGLRDGLADAAQRADAVSSERLPAGLSAGFIQFAGALERARVQADVVGALRTADPAVQAVVATMRDALGRTADAGLRQSVAVYFDDQMNRRKLAFARERGRDSLASDRRKRNAVEDFVELMAERRALDREFVSLDAVLDKLATSHADLAASRRSSARVLAEQVAEEFDAYRDRRDDFDKRRARRLDQD